LLLTATGAIAVAAQDAEQTPRPRGALTGLPSPPGTQVARIVALGEDRWLSLGSPAPDPKWGKARGRSWTPRMPYAPALRAAFLCGCGIHGYVKPDGHFMDDLWAYDIQAHRWTCVYPGADTKTLRLKLDAHGFEVDDLGRHVPVSFMGHGYCNQTYDSDRDALMFIYTHSPWWGRALPQRWTWLDQTDRSVERRYYGHAGPVIENRKHPLFYQVDEARWQRKFVEGEGPGPDRFEGVLEYIPPRRQAFFLDHGRVWFYDLAAGRWLRSPAEKIDVGYDSWGCYDSRRQRVYVARKGAFWSYDLKTDRWLPIKGKEQPADLGSCAYGAITYDVAADAVLVLLKAERAIYIYQPDKNAWTRSSLPPEADWRRGNVNAFYDPVLGAHFYHLAGDSDDNGVMLVYRWKKIDGPH